MSSSDQLKGTLGSSKEEKTEQSFLPQVVTSSYWKLIKGSFRTRDKAELGVVVHAGNSSTQEAKAGRPAWSIYLYIEFLVSHCYLMRLCLKEKKERKKERRGGIEGQVGSALTCHLVRNSVRTLSVYHHPNLLCETMREVTSLWFQFLCLQKGN